MLNLKALAIKPDNAGTLLCIAKNHCLKYDRKVARDPIFVSTSKTVFKHANLIF
jgi:hypothetical protein